LLSLACPSLPARWLCLRDGSARTLHPGRSGGPIGSGAARASQYDREGGPTGLLEFAGGADAEGAAAQLGDEVVAVDAGGVLDVLVVAEFAEAAAAAAAVEVVEQDAALLAVVGVDVVPRRDGDHRLVVAAQLVAVPQLLGQRAGHQVVLE